MYLRLFFHRYGLVLGTSFTTCPVPVLRYSSPWWSWANDVIRKICWVSTFSSMDASVPFHWKPRMWFDHLMSDDSYKKLNRTAENWQGRLFVSNLLSIFGLKRNILQRVWCGRSFAALEWQCIKQKLFRCKTMLLHAHVPINLINIFKNALIHTGNNVYTISISKWIVINILLRLQQQ